MWIEHNVFCEHGSVGVGLSYKSEFTWKLEKFCISKDGMFVPTLVPKLPSPA